MKNLWKSLGKIGCEALAVKLAAGGRKMRQAREGHITHKNRIPILTLEHVEQARQQVKVGDVLTCHILTALRDDRGGYATKRKRLPVVGKYRHLAQLYDADTGLYHSMTYVDMALERIRREKHDNTRRFN